jgi:hypothetical protein
VAKYRNVSGETLWVDLGDGRVPKVEPGDVVELDDVNRYVQTGATGETPLWEAVAPPAPIKKSAPAEKEGK